MSNIARVYLQTAETRRGRRTLAAGTDGALVETPTGIEWTESVSTSGAEGIGSKEATLVIPFANVAFFERVRVVPDPEPALPAAEETKPETPKAKRGRL
jgi:hypothetical protein